MAIAQDRRIGWVGVPAALCCSLLSVLPAEGQDAAPGRVSPTLRVEPSSVVFPTTDSQALVLVFLGDAPLSDVAAHIVGPYGWMFALAKDSNTPGAIRVRTRPDQVEAGSYTLRVTCGIQMAEAALLVTLEEMPSVLEQEAARLDGGMEEARLLYGLATRLLPEDLSIQLPGPYYEGAILEIPLSRHDDRSYRWRVDDEVVLEGLGESVVRIPLVKPGLCRIGVAIEEGSQVAAQWEGSVQVLAEPVQPLRVPAGAPFALAGPSDYESYEWHVDDELAGTCRVFRHVIGRSGQHRIECRAAGPHSDPHRVLRRIVWEAAIE